MAPRIHRLRISNYRSVGKDQVLAFDDLTVLVGTNGSGKSNLVDALSFVRDAMLNGLNGAITDRGGIQAVRRWSSGRPFNVSLELELDLAPGFPARYQFEITGDRQEEYRVKHEACEVTTPRGTVSFRVERGAWSGPSGLEPMVNETSLALPTVAGDERFQPLFETLSQLVIYSIYPDTLRTPQRYSPERPMQRGGQNWVSILRDQNDPTFRPELVAGLRKLTGDICDLKVERAASYLVAQFKHGTNGHGKWFDAGQESDGTLRVAGILTALLQEPPLPLIGIEEPELTVHPGALPLLVDYLRQTTLRSQVLITTHSPELLDCIEPESVRVVSRSEAGTTVGSMASEQQASVKDHLLGLGELMVSEGLNAELPFEGA